MMFVTHLFISFRE